MSHSDTHIYVDLDIVNTSQNNNQPPPILRFEETRNAPFLPGDSAEYFVSIIRFSVQTGNEIPVFIPRIETGSDQMDINKTIYKVSVECNGMVSTAPLIWEPWDLSAEVPKPPVVKQDIMTRYYYMSNFAQFVPMMNKALESAWGITKSTANNAPFIDFDPDSCKFNINADVDFMTTGTKIYFNTSLYELFCSFPAKFKGYAGDCNYELAFLNNHDLNTKPILRQSESGKCQVLKYHAVQIFQEIATVSIWSPVRSIVFTSSLLPIKATNTSAPKVFNDSSDNSGSLGLISSGAPNLSSVITDFEVGITATNQYRPDILFRVESEYRLIDLYSMNNLNRIDISVWWKSSFGDLIPVHINPGCSASLKLMFRRKSFET
jgi:hypothetical protein